MDDRMAVTVNAGLAVLLVIALLIALWSDSDVEDRVLFVVVVGSFLLVIGLAAAGLEELVA